MTKIPRPDMIIFDYGHTLLYQPGHNTSNGNKAIYPYIDRNPYKVSFEEFDKTMISLFAKIKAERGILEIHEHSFLKLAMEYMGISFSVSLEEAEKIIMNGISKGGVMPHADEMLDFLNSKGIRTGVISNNCFSGNALSELFERLLPRNKLEFILSSSDFIFNKPHSMMFEIALKKAGLPPEKVWYCGDNPKADVEGAAGVGIFPVWYDNDSEYTDRAYVPKCEHLHINEWQEMIEILEQKCLN